MLQYHKRFGLGDRNGQLFFKLTGQRCCNGFTRFNLSAGKLPFVTLMLLGIAQRQQYLLLVLMLPLLLLLKNNPYRYMQLR